MRLVGVIDLMSGIVVHAVAGQRHAYRPLVSRLCADIEPVAVAWSLVKLGLGEIYVADLDAIGGAEPAWDLLRQLNRLGVLVWVDAGVREASRATALREMGISRVVVGLETWPDVGSLTSLVEQLEDQLVFSLDLRDGTPIGREETPWEIARQVIAAGVRRILVLDLARVGVRGGPGTLALCAKLAREYPGVEVSAGGGIRDTSDLESMRSAGVAAVLVASALHDGRLGADDIARL